jgi:dTMP kinase
MFITFEGIEGVGKTTQLKFMAERLRKAGIPVLLTREPGGTEIGEEVRDILLKHRHERVAPLTELLLMFAARAQHVDTIIKPALEKGRWVLCDRFTDASYAYQGGGRGIDRDEIEVLENLVLGDFRPNYTLLFDAPVEIGLKRVNNRGSHDRFEREKMDFFERVRAAYGLRAQMNLKRYKIIDASKPVEVVEKEVAKVCDEIIWKHQ